MTGCGKLLTSIPLCTGLNFFNAVNETLFDVDDGLAQCVLEANAAYQAVGDALYGFEIGNEVDCLSSPL